MTNKSQTKGDHSPILNNSSITTYNQVKYDFVIARKNEIYVPLLEEVLTISQNIFKVEHLNRIKNDFIKEVILKQYKYRVEDKLLNKLIEIDEVINKFNKIDIENISGKIIEKMFIKGFTKIYGDIIDGEAPIYYEGDIVDYETVYPEEYENIRLIAFDNKLLTKVIQGSDDYMGYDDELYNSALITMFEFALADRNKRYSPKRVPIVEWEGAPEEYIAAQSDFKELYNTHSSILEKRTLKKYINDLCEELKVDLDEILKGIFIKYEKE